MKDQPRLLAVPHFFNHLTVKADLNGITVLKDGRFKKRYTGSKQFEVDINGKLRTKKELQELVEEVGEKEFEQLIVWSTLLRIVIVRFWNILW